MENTKLTSKKETINGIAFKETVGGIAGLAMDTYLNGVKFSISMWEDYLKVFNSQVDHLLNLQQEYIKAGKDFYEKFPAPTLWNGIPSALDNLVDSFVDSQKDYVESVRSASDKFAKETLKLTQKNVKEAFSLFDYYINLLKL